MVSLFQSHKYVVQAEVLYKSWDLDESQLAFVHMLKDMEKNEMRGMYTKNISNTMPEIQLNIFTHNVH